MAEAWPTPPHTVPPHIVTLRVKVLIEILFVMNRQVILAILYLFHIY